MDMTITNETGLDTLTGLIRDAIERRESGKDQWVAATIDLCQRLSEARGRFRDDKAFGAWLDASGVGLSHQDRAAAIAMGKEMDVTREVLAQTERRSLQHIHAKEFKRFTHASKPEKPAKRAKPKATPPDVEKALRAYDRRKLAGEALTEAAVMEEAGTKRWPVRNAFTIRHAEEKLANGGEVADLSATAQQKLEAAIRRETRRLDLEAHTRAIEESRKLFDEVSLPHYFKVLERVQELIKYKKGVMPRNEYRKILACLHPDMARDGHTKRFEEAFQLFNQYEARLVSDSEQADLKMVSTLPRTREEMLARKRAKR